MLTTTTTTTTMMMTTTRRRRTTPWLAVAAAAVVPAVLLLATSIRTSNAFVVRRPINNPSCCWHPSSTSTSSPFCSSASKVCGPRASTVTRSDEQGFVNQQEEDHQDDDHDEEDDVDIEFLFEEPPEDDDDEDEEIGAYEIEVEKRARFDALDVMEKAWRYAKKPLLRIGSKGATHSHGNSLRQLLDDHTVVKVKVNTRKYNDDLSTAASALRELAVENGAPADLEVLQMRDAEKVVLFGLPGTLQKCQDGSFPPPPPPPPPLPPKSLSVDDDDDDDDEEEE